MKIKATLFVPILFLSLLQMTYLLAQDDNIQLVDIKMIKDGENIVDTSFRINDMDDEELTKIIGEITGKEIDLRIHRSGTFLFTDHTGNLESLINVHCNDESIEELLVSSSESLATEHLVYVYKHSAFSSNKESSDMIWLLSDSEDWNFNFDWNGDLQRISEKFDLEGINIDSLAALDSGNIVIVKDSKIYTIDDQTITNADGKYIIKNNEGVVVMELERLSDHEYKIKGGSGESLKMMYLQSTGEHDEIKLWNKVLIISDSDEQDEYIDKHKEHEVLVVIEEEMEEGSDDAKNRSVVIIQDTQIEPSSEEDGHVKIVKLKTIEGDKDIQIEIQKVKIIDLDEGEIDILEKTGSNKGK